MLDLTKIKNNSSQKQRRVHPGEYTLEVLDVNWAEGFVPNTAIDYSYKLTNANGETFNFSERFFIRGHFERTKRFKQYLEKNGLDYNSFVGCKEEVKIANNEKKFPEIYERKLI